MKIISDSDPIKNHPLTHSIKPTIFCRNTLLNNAFTIINDDKWGAWKDNRIATLYFSKYQVRLQIYKSCIKITTLAKALDARKTCEVFTIHWGFDNETEGYYKFLNWVGLISPTSCITGVLAHLYVANYKDSGNSKFEAKLTSDLTVTRRDIKSGQVFSPFKLDKLKPVTKIPEKIRANHLIKLIANGQYRQLLTTNVCTDDFFGDAANNFGRKVHENPFELLISLIENRSNCFHLFHSGNGVYSFGDHRNDNKTIIPVLENRFPTE